MTLQDVITNHNITTIMNNIGDITVIAQIGSQARKELFGVSDYSVQHALNDRLIMVAKVSKKLDGAPYGN